MVTCGFCFEAFQQVKDLMCHLKFIHNCGKRCLHRCGEEGCFRSFPTQNSFKKHIKVHNNNTNDSLVLEENTPRHCLLQGKTIPETEILIGDDYFIGNDETDFTLKPESLSFDYCESLKVFQDKLQSNVLCLITKLYADSTFSRKDVQTILDSVTDLLSEPIKLFKYALAQLMQSYSVSEHYRENILIYISEFQNMFKTFGSEYLRFKYLVKSEDFISPVPYVVGQRFDNVKEGRALPRNYTSQFIPLGEVLKKYFEQPNVLRKTQEYMNSLKTEKYISNIVQSDFWKNKVSKFRNNEIVLPLFIYFDEYESGNPLGSHSGIHKLGAVYCSVPVIPAKYQAKLENIFLTLLFHSSDLKQFGTKLIFSKLVEHCKKLEYEGILCNIDRESTRIFFCVALLLGDNLGLHTLLGFTESFRANSFCRFCKCHRNETYHLSKQQDELLRNRTNFEEDIAVNNVSLTGIKEQTPWNNLPSFHATDNPSVDIAHDIFEGVASFDVTEILYQFIIVDKLFTIETLNSRLKYFNYGKDNVNKPPLIAIENLKHKKIRMSCAEMKCFLLYAGLMLGNLIPEENKFWKLYILLRKILAIVLSPRIYNLEATCNLLSDLISEHHNLYVELFSLNLKPKHHNLIHYPWIMRRVGPLIHLSSIRFESKHRESKTFANVVASRVNITHTLAIKHQLKQCHRFITKSGLGDCITKTVVKNMKSIYECIPDFDQLCLESEIIEKFSKSVSFCKSIGINNFTYKTGDLLLIGRETDILFGVIETILQNEDNQVCFVYSPLKVVFREHIYAYEVIGKGNKKCILESSIYFWPHLNLSTYDNIKCITIF